MSSRLGLIGLVVLFLSAIALTWKIQSWRYEALISAKDRDQAMAVAQVYEKVRLIEKQKQQRMEAIVNDATLQIVELQGAVYDGGAVSKRLRKELARYRANAADACTATGGEATSDPIGVLIGLLEGLESTGRTISEYADRARIAGSACEKAYDEIK